MVVAVKNRRFDLPDHYYVYGLAKPNGDWFYIGKGKGNRIIKHFQSEEMSKDSYKSRVINKYGKENIHKEIFSYLEDEDAAYELEEFTISEIGLENLANTIPARYMTGEVSKGWDGWKKAVDDMTKYSDDLLVECYRKYFEHGLTAWEISQETGVPREYLNGAFRGKYRKALYAEWIESGRIQDGFETRPVKVLSQRKVSDEDLIELYPRVVAGELSLSDVSDLLGVHSSWLSAIFCGKKRPYLGFNIAQERQVRSKTYQRELRKSKISWFLDQGYSAPQISRITGHSRSYVHVIKKELENGT